MDVRDDLDIFDDHSVALYFKEGVEVEAGQFCPFCLDFMHLLTNTLSNYQSLISSKMLVLSNVTLNDAFELFLLNLLEFCQ